MLMPVLPYFTTRNGAWIARQIGTRIGAGVHARGWIGTRVRTWVLAHRWIGSEIGTWIVRQIGIRAVAWVSAKRSAVAIVIR